MVDHEGVDHSKIWMNLYLSYMGPLTLKLVGTRNVLFADDDLRNDVLRSYKIANGNKPVRIV